MRDTRTLIFRDKPKSSYEYDLVEIMSQFGGNWASHLTEKEVFIGTIIGRSGAGSRRQREQSEVMRDRYRREVREVIAWMRGKGDEARDDDDPALPLATACLYLGMNTEKEKWGGLGGREVRLRSFGWIAAGVCVREVFARVGEVSEIGGEPWEDD